MEDWIYGSLLVTVAVGGYGRFVAICFSGRCNRTSVRGGVVTYAPQLSLELSTLAAAVEPGQVVEFELMVNNHGPDEGQGIQVGALPAGDLWYLTGPNLPAGGGSLWQQTIESLPAGQSQRFSFSLTLTGLPAEDLQLTATALTNGQPAIQQSYTLPVVRPAVETMRVGQGEDSLHLLDNRLSLANWEEGPATLQASLHEWHANQPGRIIRFDLSANRLDGSPIPPRQKSRGRQNRLCLSANATHPRRFGLFPGGKNSRPLGLRGGKIGG